MSGACAASGSWQSLAVVLGALSVDVEILRAYSALAGGSLEDPLDARGLQAVQVVVLLVTLALLLTWVVNAAACNSALQSGETYEEVVQANPPVSCCACMHSMGGIEGVLSWTIETQELGLSAFSTDSGSRDSCFAFVSRMAVLRLALLEVPHLILFAWLWMQFGGWFSLHVGIAAVFVSLASSASRLVLWWSKYDPGSAFAQNLCWPLAFICCLSSSTRRAVGVQGQHSLTPGTANSGSDGFSKVASAPNVPAI